MSHAIKGLETELRCALFQRTGRGVKLTPNGHKFLAIAEQILMAMEAARAAIHPDGATAAGSQHTLGLDQEDGALAPRRAFDQRAS